MQDDDRTVVPVEPGHDLRGTLGQLRHGARDRAIRFLVDGSVWRATDTPEGLATGRYRPAPGSVVVDAWGPGAGWLLANAAALVGALDDDSGFTELAASHRVVARIHRDHGGLRVPRSLAVYEAALPVVIEQKVTGMEARRTWRALLDRFGRPAPGPPAPAGPPLRVPPGAGAVADIPYARLHPLGLERKRAETLRAVARAADRLERTTVLPSMVEAHAVLRSVPGIGAWTAAEIAIVALGDADAVSVGDYHLPNHVCFALAGERAGTDERMLELLAPFAPHRGRVIRLLGRAAARPERRGPRLAPIDNRRR